MKNRSRVVFFCLAAFLLCIDVSANSSRRRDEEKFYSQSKQRDCRDNLKSFYGSFKLYASSNRGLLPAKNNLNGLQELFRHGISYSDFQCRQYKGKKFKIKDLEKSDRKEKKGKRSNKKNKDRFTEEHSPYVYFGGINLNSAVKRTPKLVIMCNKPDSRHFYALLCDGTIEEIVIEKGDDDIKKVADIVKYLHKKYKYPAEVRQVLLNKSEAIEKEWKKGKE